MMNLGLMDLATSNVATVSVAADPGVIVGVLGPVLGVMAAMVFASLTYGFIAIGAAALHRTAPPSGDSRPAPVQPELPGSWEITPTIAHLLRSASGSRSARDDRRATLQTISSPRPAV